MVKKSEKIAVIGGGRIGQSMRKVLKDHGKTVFLWDRDEARMHVHVSLKDTITDAGVVIICVPSWALRESFQEMKPFLRRGAVVTAFAKGIERGTLKTSPEIAKEEIPGHPFLVFGGPFMAEEMDHGFLGVGVLGGASLPAFRKMESLFRGTNVKLFRYPDARSIALAGVLKNVYAVSLGLADGLGWGTNAKGWVSAKVSEELLRAGKILRVKEEALRGAGTSDFYASGFSPYSRNRKTGEEILKWNAASIQSESMASFPSVAKMLGPCVKTLPIFKTLHAIVSGKTDPKKSFERLFL